MDVSQLWTSITWSGSKNEVARKLEVELVQAEYLKTQSLNLELHKMVQFFDGEIELFRGYIFNIDKSLQDSTMLIGAYDAGIFLLKSQSHCKFKRKTPDEVTRQVCKEVNVPVGHLEKGAPYDRIHDGDSIYEIIMTGYSLHSRKTGQQYYAYMDKGLLNIAKKGKVVFKYVLNSDNDLLNANYALNSEDAINQVKAYDDSGNLVGTVRLDDYQKFAGTLQAIYKGGDKASAKALLKKPQREISVESLGFSDCLSGKAVIVKEPITKLNGLFYIDADSHTFSDGLHKMTLTLALNNVMSTAFAGSESEDEASLGGVDDSLSASGDGKTTGKMTWPVPGTRVITQGFGGSNGHRGIDIGGAQGAVIVAADGGVVIHSGYGEDQTYGASIVIQHSNGLFTRYAHLSSVGVRAGQSVSKGQKIGRVGNTGRSFGPHLHFEVLSGSKWGQLKNPVHYVK